MWRRLLSRRLATIPTQDKGAANLLAAQKYFNEGIQHWNQDNLEMAKTSFERSIKLMPTSDAFYNLASVYHSLGKTELSLENWKHSVEQSPRCDALVNIANIYALKLGDFRKALAYYERALALDKDDGETHYNYAVVLDQDGQLEKAIEHYSIAVSFGIAQAEGTLRNARARWLAKKTDENKQAST
ncbi:hypothetical protein HDU91_003957 [Kappamyces sp. JEL0680]|nr:hypothetical protein HDU91_003957 [Kappamyces sp. JEL0680]